MSRQNGWEKKCRATHERRQNQNYNYGKLLLPNKDKYLIIIEIEREAETDIKHNAEHRSIHRK